MTYMSKIEGQNCQSVDVIEMAVEASLARIRTHPFIVGGMRGALSKEQSIRWVLCAGRESKSFPDILRGMLETCRVGEIRAVLEDNLRDELGGGNPDHAHFKHYVVLLEQLGMSQAYFDNYEEGPGIKFALELAYAMARTARQGVALGYMLVNEGMTQITYKAAREALHRHFEMSDDTFFTLHVEVDEEHVALLYQGLRATSELAVRDVLYGIELGERGMAVLLDEALGTFDQI